MVADQFEKQMERAAAAAQIVRTNPGFMKDHMAQIRWGDGISSGLPLCGNTKLTGRKAQRRSTTPEHKGSRPQETTRDHTKAQEGTRKQGGAGGEPWPPSGRFGAVLLGCLAVCCRANGDPPRASQPPCHLALVLSLWSGLPPPFCSPCALNPRPPCAPVLCFPCGQCAPFFVTHSN